MVNHTVSSSFTTPLPLSAHRQLLLSLHRLSYPPGLDFERERERAVSESEINLASVHKSNFTFEQIFLSNRRNPSNSHQLTASQNVLSRLLFVLLLFSSGVRRLCPWNPPDHCQHRLDHDCGILHHIYLLKFLTASFIRRSSSRTLTTSTQNHLFWMR